MSETQRKVLIVDDEETIRELLKQTLEEVGYSVITATNGLEALEQVSLLEVNVVLLDIKMPGMSGMEVLAKLTADWPETCVIMVTGVADMQTAIEAMKLGAYDYLVKPLNLDDVVVKIQRAIEKKDSGLKNKHTMIELQQSVKEQAERLQAQFNELIHSLSREHKLLHDLAARQPSNGKSLLSKLPLELQEPLSSVEEFKDALIRILRRM